VLEGCLSVADSTKAQSLETTSWRHAGLLDVADLMAGQDSWWSECWIGVIIKLAALVKALLESGRSCVCLLEHLSTSPSPDSLVSRSQTTGKARVWDGQSWRGLQAFSTPQML
jgi:hypothetical protein